MSNLKMAVDCFRSQPTRINCESFLKELANCIHRSPQHIQTSCSGLSTPETLQHFQRHFKKTHVELAGQFAARCRDNALHLVEAATLASHIHAGVRELEDHDARLFHWEMYFLSTLHPRVQEELRVPLVSVDPGNQGHLYYLVLTRMTGFSESRHLIEHPENALRPIDDEFRNAIQEAFDANSSAPFTVLWRLEMSAEENTQMEWLPQIDRSCGGAAAVAFWLMSRELPADPAVLVAACHREGKLERVDSGTVAVKLSVAFNAKIRTIVADTQLGNLGSGPIEKARNVTQAALLVSPAGRIFKHLCAAQSTRRLADFASIPIEVSILQGGRQEVERKPWSEHQHSTRSVIAADPGLGKSHLLREETERVNRPTILDLDQGLVTPNIRLAFLVSASELADSNDDLAVRVADAVMAELSFPIDGATARDWLVKKLRDGTCLLVLDSVDRSRNVSRLWSSIAAFAKANPRANFLISTRFARFSPLPDTSNFVLREFSPRQFEEALHLWLPDHPRACESLKRLQHTRRRLVRVLHSPLILKLICRGTRGSNDTSDAPYGPWETRAQLWSDFIEHQLFAEIDGLENAKELGFYDKLTEVAECVARECIDTGRDSWSAEELKRFFPQDHRLGGDPLEVFCRLGLLVQQSPSARSGFDWSHLQMAEYLAGCHLARTLETTRSWDLIERKSWDPNWQEAILFLAQEMKDADKLRTLLERFLDEDQPAREVFHYRLPLAALCLTEVSEDVFGQLQGYLIDTIITRVFLFWRWAWHSSILPERFLNLQEAVRAALGLEGKLLAAAKEESTAWPLLSGAGRGPNSDVEWTKDEPWPAWVAELLERPNPAEEDRHGNEVSALVSLTKIRETGALTDELAERLYPKLLTMMQSSNSDTRVRALKLVESYPEMYDHVVDGLRELLATEDDERLVAGMWALKSVGAATDRDLLERVQQCCIDPHRSADVRVVALHVLPRLTYLRDDATHEECMDQLLEVWARDQWDSLNQRDFIVRQFISGARKNGRQWEVNSYLENRDSRDIRFEAFDSLIIMAEQARQRLRRLVPPGHRGHYGANFVYWLKKKAANRPKVFRGAPEEFDWLAEFAINTINDFPRCTHGGQELAVAAHLFDEWRRDAHAPILAEFPAAAARCRGILPTKIAGREISSRVSYPDTSRWESVCGRVLRLPPWSVRREHDSQPATEHERRPEDMDLESGPNPPIARAERKWTVFRAKRLEARDTGNPLSALRNQKSVHQGSKEWDSAMQELESILQGFGNWTALVEDERYSHLRRFLIGLANRATAENAECRLAVVLTVVNSLLASSSPQFIPSLAFSPLQMFSIHYDFRIFAPPTGPWTFSRLDDLTGSSAYHKRRK